MKNFKVYWYIDIEAETPEQAAQKALEIQRDKNSTNTIFDVHLNDECCQVDLLEYQPNVTVNIDPKPIITSCFYVSEWEEGVVKTNCDFELETGEISNIESVECSFDHLLSEYIELNINSDSFTLSVENGELTEESKEYFFSVIQNKVLANES